MEETHLESLLVSSLKTHDCIHGVWHWKADEVTCFLLPAHGNLVETTAPFCLMPKIKKEK